MPVILITVMVWGLASPTQTGKLGPWGVIEVASALELKCVQAAHPGSLSLELLSVRTNLLVFCQPSIFGCLIFKTLLLCSSGYPGTSSGIELRYSPACASLNINQAGLELRGPPASS